MTTCCLWFPGDVDVGECWLAAEERVLVPGAPVCVKLPGTGFFGIGFNGGPGSKAPLRCGQGPISALVQEVLDVFVCCDCWLPFFPCGVSDCFGPG